MANPITNPVGTIGEKIEASFKRYTWLRILSAEHQYVSNQGPIYVDKAILDPISSEVVLTDEERDWRGAVYSWRNKNIDFLCEGILDCHTSMVPFEHRYYLRH